MFRDRSVAIAIQGSPTDLNQFSDRPRLEMIPSINRSAKSINTLKHSCRLFFLSVLRPKPLEWAQWGEQRGLDP
jgi:hypothetical protein